MSSKQPGAVRPRRTARAAGSVASPQGGKHLGAAASAAPAPPWTPRGLRPRSEGSVYPCRSALRPCPGPEARRFPPRRQTGGPTTRPACLVVSSAIGSNNPEVQEAFRLGIPVVDRRQWMPAATEGADVVAVAGTHGKSTTSAMLGWALAGAGRGPYVSLVGAQVPQFSLPALGLHVEPGPEGRGADLAPGFAADARTAGDLASPAAGAVAAGEEIPDEGLRARMVVEVRALFAFPDARRADLSCGCRKLSFDSQSC